MNFWPRIKENQFIEPGELLKLVELVELIELVLWSPLDGVFTEKNKVPCTGWYFSFKF